MENVYRLNYSLGNNLIGITAVRHSSALKLFAKYLFTDVAESIVLF